MSGHKYEPNDFMDKFDFFRATEAAELANKKLDSLVAMRMPKPDDSAQLAAKDKQIAELTAELKQTEHAYENSKDSERNLVFRLGDIMSEHSRKLAKYKAALKKIRAYTGDAHICEITSAAFAEDENSESSGG